MEFEYIDSKDCFIKDMAQILYNIAQELEWGLKVGSEPKNLIQVHIPKIRQVAEDLLK